VRAGEGRCLCGAVRYEVTGTPRDVVECHRAMCRKTHGHSGACTATPKDGLRITEARGLEILLAAGEQLVSSRGTDCWR
jgi:hypothetical protein